jgi:hypothetical protein
VDKKLIILSILVVFFILYTLLYFSMKADIKYKWNDTINFCIREDRNNKSIAIRERELVSFPPDLINENTEIITQIKDCDASGGCWTCIPCQMPQNFNYLSPIFYGFKTCN